MRWYECYWRLEAVVLLFIVLFYRSGLAQKENAGDNLDYQPVLASDLLNIMEESILTFRTFLKMDKKKSNRALNLFKGQNQDASSLHQVQTSLDKVTQIQLTFFFFAMIRRHRDKHHSLALTQGVGYIIVQNQYGVFIKYISSFNS